jgi:hypothetical protein
VGLSMKEPSRPSAVHGALALLPRRVATALVEQITWKAFVDDVELDFPIWQNKAYIQRPALAAGDGPIAPYRRWATQFYGDGAPAMELAPE